MSATQVEETPVRWLDVGEMATWLDLVHLVVTLPQALDRQLRAEAGISHVYYSILATLSDRADRRSPMAELARVTGLSLSRLSHAIDTLCDKGWVQRFPTADPRRQLAGLTEDGAALLERIAPGHLAEVRRLVFDRLEPEQVAQLAEIASRLLQGISDVHTTRRSARSPRSRSDAATSFR